MRESEELDKKMVCHTTYSCYQDRKSSKNTFSFSGKKYNSYNPGLKRYGLFLLVLFLLTGSLFAANTIVSVSTNNFPSSPYTLTIGSGDGATTGNISLTNASVVGGEIDIGKNTGVVTFPTLTSASTITINADIGNRKNLSLYSSVDGGAFAACTTWAGSSSPQNYSYTSNATGTVQYRLQDASGNSCAVHALTINDYVPDPTSANLADDQGSYEVALSWSKTHTGNVLVIQDVDGGGTSPAYGTAYAVGDVVTGTDTVVYTGSGTSFSHTGLSASTTYSYEAWAVGAYTNYSSNGLSDNATTLEVPPTPSNFTSTPSGNEDINLTWTSPGTYDGSNNYQMVIIYNKTGVGGVTDPVEGQSYGLGNTDLGGTVIFSGDAVSATSFLHESLTEGTYYYYAWTHNSYHNYSNRATDNAEPALPITLSDFVADYVNGAVHLSWETASELDNARFLIYRNDEIIASLEGAGTTSEPQVYEYTDHYVIPGNTYTYTLADVSYANVEVKHNNMSRTVTIDEDHIGKNYFIGDAYPNPFNPSSRIPLNLAKESDIHAELYDMNGRVVQELLRGSLNAGSYDLTINGRQLTSGVYFVKIRIQEEVLFKKVTLLK